MILTRISPHLKNSSRDLKTAKIRDRLNVKILFLRMISEPEYHSEQSIEEVVISLNEVEIVDKKETYSSCQHSKKLLSRMDEMRGDDFDIQIIVKGETINAHKIILKASSKYFQGLFNSGMREAIDDKITIEDFEFDIINSLVNFLYTSKLEVTSDNVFAMYQASDLYEIETARNFCSQFLIDSLTHRNCFELFFAARLYTNKRLMNEIIKFISCHIDFISKSDGFLRLNIEDICQLFNSESFIFTSETELFKSILAWVCRNGPLSKAFHILLR